VLHLITSKKSDIILSLVLKSDIILSLVLKSDIILSLVLKSDIKAEYSLRESVSAQGREGRGFDSDPGRNLKIIKKRLYSVS
jgi:hypothetical protein